MVPDAVAGVALYHVPPEIAHRRPGVEEPWPAGDDVRHSVPALTLLLSQRLLQRSRRLWIGSVDDRLGEAMAESDGMAVVRHAMIFARVT